MRLAICVVYIVRPGNEWLLRLHLRKIAQSTDVPYRILGVAIHSSDKAMEILKRRKKVELVDIPRTDATGSPEHAYYLGHLLDVAAKRNFTHFATLDADSFPIAPGWAPHLAGSMSPGRPFAGVLRTENGDRMLPHPSGILCDMTFYQRTRPTLLPSRKDYFSAPSFWLRHLQRRDVGVGLAIAAQQNKCDWIKLRRSNSLDVHPLMAGVYGNVFFHLGAMSRAPHFEVDWYGSARNKFLWRCRHLGAFPRTREKIARGIVERNQILRSDIVRNLRDDADGYLENLRHGTLEKAS